MARWNNKVPAAVMDGRETGSVLDDMRSDPNEAAIVSRAQDHRVLMARCGGHGGRWQALCQDGCGQAGVKIWARIRRSGGPSGETLKAAPPQAGDSEEWLPSSARSPATRGRVGTGQVGDRGPGNRLQPPGHSVHEPGARQTTRMAGACEGVGTCDRDGDEAGERPAGLT